MCFLGCLFLRKAHIFEVVLFEFLFRILFVNFLVIFAGFGFRFLSCFVAFARGIGCFECLLEALNAFVGLGRLGFALGGALFCEGFLGCFFEVVGFLARFL